MKYNLPRGSFGGDYWHDCVYALDTPNFYSIVPGHDSNNHYCPLGGGAVPAVGNYPGLRFIENLDYRAPSNDASQVGTLGASGLVDPNLKPMQQHEMVLGAEFALAKDLVLETRYSRKRLDRTIEDAGSVTPNGEIYYIVNPGFGVNTKVADCPGCPAKNQKAVRNYDGIEFRLTKRMADNWTASVSYTRSKLNGNYSGLTATDISDGGGARDGANADRAFDEAFMQYDTHGKPIDGPLATDRPNQVKGWVNYTLKWWKFNTNFGIVQQIASGVPLSSYVSVWGAPVFVEGRGNWVDVTRDAATGNWV
jgi:hypothetical protein